MGGINSSKETYMFIRFVNLYMNLMVMKINMTKFIRVKINKFIIYEISLGDTL